MNTRPRTRAWISRKPPPAHPVRRAGAAGPLEVVPQVRHCVGAPGYRSVQMLHFVSTLARLAPRLVRPAVFSAARLDRQPAPQAPQVTLRPRPPAFIGAPPAP